jgi:hypothetical protein
MVASLLSASTNGVYLMHLVPRDHNNTRQIGSNSLKASTSSSWTRYVRLCVDLVPAHVFFCQFDQVDRDITPLLALPDSTLKKRLDMCSKEPHSYNYAVEKGNSSIGGPLVKWDIPAELQRLVSPFAKDLPDMMIYVSGHDGGPTILGEDMRQAVDAILKRGQRKFRLFIQFHVSSYIIFRSDRGASREARRHTT